MCELMKTVFYFNTIVFHVYLLKRTLEKTSSYVCVLRLSDCCFCHTSKFHSILFCLCYEYYCTPTRTHTHTEGGRVRDRRERKGRMERGERDRQREKHTYTYTDLPAEAAVGRHCRGCPRREAPSR